MDLYVNIDSTVFFRLLLRRVVSVALFLFCLNNGKEDHDHRSETRLIKFMFEIIL